jgi:transposase
MRSGNGSATRPLAWIQWTRKHTEHSCINVCVQAWAEYDAADRDGKGALLRREAIYTSHISEWRKARDRGTLHAPARRRKSAEQVELERLRKRTERLEAELAKTKLALDITGKAHALLELLSESAHDDTKRSR